ncbi:hypothetical protein BV25DRAFT_1935882 [Artomyces pyxidatus]|uniref:Uncharacterized protein n=1 Tax=Artomyces pyxidatus TaxID=48021 RepID=A0ACB8T661_9AGAM|nr:hypothetical protein BV25DRAFT_1935882 [Artomyces pyxidatus]
MPATYPFPAAYTPYPPSARSPRSHAANAPYPVRSPKPDYAPGAALLYPQVATPSSPTAGPGVPCRLPPIMQVEKQQVTTTATQAASASRRRNEAHFICPVPGCGSTFTRRFNLRGHLRSHTEERPYVCEWPGCNKGFARQHDCKRHQALHSTKSTNNACQGCGKTFSRLDALNVSLRSEGGSECRHASGEPSTKPKKESTASPESHDGAGGASAAP